jgi:hypothetical protein
MCLRMGRYFNVTREREKGRVKETAHTKNETQIGTGIN